MSSEAFKALAPFTTHKLNEVMSKFERGSFKLKAITWWISQKESKINMYNVSFLVN